MALTAAWLGPDGHRPDNGTLRKLLSAACGHTDAAVRAAGASAVPAVMASVTRLTACGLSQARTASHWATNMNYFTEGKFVF